MFPPQRARFGCPRAATNHRFFLRTLAACHLEHTLTGAKTLEELDEIRYYRHDGRVTPLSAEQIKSRMAPIERVLWEECRRKEILLLDTTAVSERLRDLAGAAVLNDAQQRLLEETILCLECGAYRAAVVMGWNLAYDVIRRWVFANKLDPFNQQLTTQYQDRNGKPTYTPIQKYEDFSAGKPSERTVIDTCYFAGIIGEKLRDELRQCLRRRNEYAHASTRSPTAQQANAYIDDLIDIITSPPFNLTAKRS